MASLFVKPETPAPRKGSGQPPQLVEDSIVVPDVEVTPLQNYQWTLPPILPDPRCRKCLAGGKAGPCARHHFLGGGAFGKVYVGKPTNPSNSEMAMKVLQNTVRGRSKRKEIEREISIMRLVSSIHSENLLKLVDVYYTSTETILVVPLLGTEVFEHLVTKGQFNETGAFNLMSQLTNVVKYLHDKKICHFDIKLQNLAFQKDGKTVTLIDLGYAKGPYDWPKTLDRFIGTMAFAAPEAALQRSYGYGTDVFAMGVTLYLLVCGMFPFSPYMGEQGVPHDKEKKTPKPINAKIPVSDDCRDLIYKMLCVDSNSRISIDGILKHPWFIKKQFYSDNRTDNIMSKNYFSYARNTTLSRLISAFPAAKVVADTAGTAAPAQVTMKVSSLTGNDWSNLRDIFHKIASTEEHEDIKFSQFGDLMRSVGLERFATSHVFVLFEKRGQGINGSLNFREFILNLIALRGKGELSHKFLFDFFDIDKNGKIGLDGLKNILLSLVQEDLGDSAARGYNENIAESLEEMLGSAFISENDDSGAKKEMNFAQFSEWYSTDLAKKLLDKAFRQNVSEAVKKLRNK